MCPAGSPFYAPTGFSLIEARPAAVFFQIVCGGDIKQEKETKMPKLKTNRGAAKRLRFTKTGKIKKRKAGRGHVLGKKTRKRKRHLRKSDYLSKVEEKRIRRLLPYGSN